MDLSELQRFRDDLDEFVGDVFASLTRKGWQERASCYMTGLLGPGRRKSVQPMAARLGEDDQSIRHFLACSPWDPVPVRARLAAKMGPVVNPHGWVIDDTSFPKSGKASPCVASQYCGAVKTTANCQVATTVHLASDTASCPVNWRLFVPASWDPADPKASIDVQARRAAAGIPDHQQHRTKWELALDAIDELLDWGIPAPAVVCADSGYGNTADFRHGLTSRNLPYAVQIRPDTLMLAPEPTPEHTPAPAGSGGLAARLRATQPWPDYPINRNIPATAASVIAAAGPRRAHHITWRTGSRNQPLTSRFVFARVRPAGLNVQRLHPGQPLPECWLIAQWPTGKTEPTTYWLSTLDPNTSKRKLIRACKLRWRVEHDYRELKTGLGLDHFEGRTWQGWHHHVTLVTAAHAFCTLQRLNPKAHTPA